MTNEESSDTNLGLTDLELQELEELEEIEATGGFDQLEELEDLDDLTELVDNKGSQEETNKEPEEVSDDDGVSLHSIVEETVGAQDSEGHSSFQFNSPLKIEYKLVDIGDIVIPEKKKKARTDTMIGLDSSVKEFGILNPIHLIQLEDDDSYLLLQGLRRLRAGAKAGIMQTMAVVLNFGDKEEGKRLANVLDELINRSQHYSNREIWSNFTTLELVNGVSVGMLEFLLQLNAGEAMKLRDVMTSDYNEIISEFTEGNLTIESAYKKLNTERSKEDKLMKENETTVEGTEGLATYEEEELKELSDTEVDELLDLATDTDDMSLEELDRRHEDGVERQEVGNRKPLDPALRNAVLLRDESTCQCCGKGGKEWLHVMDIHHIIQVSQGGADVEKNLVTVCINCHQSIHVYAWGKLMIDLKDLDDGQKEVFKNILKFGNIIRDADKKRKGRGVDTSKDKETNVRKMPGVVQSENAKAMQLN